MITHSLYRFFQDSVNKHDKKYKVIKIYNNNKEITVECELISSGQIISFTLEEIIINNKLRYFSSKDIINLSRNFEQQKGQAYNQKELKYFHILSMAFIISLLSANVGATKLISVFGMIIPAGIVVFPLLYILNDTLTEVYGFTASRKVIWSALWCNLIFTIILWAMVFFPPAPIWDNQEGFAKIFMMSPKIFLASILSYLIGEGTNSSIISILKIKLRGKLFFIRAITSTTIAAFIETFIFCNIAFIGYLEYKIISEMIIILSCIKVSYELLMMPLTIRIVLFFKKSEELDVYEKPTFKAIFLPFIK